MPPQHSRDEPRDCSQNRKVCQPCPNRPHPPKCPRRTHATQAKNRSPARGALPALCTRAILLDSGAPLQRVPGVPNGLPRKSASSHIGQRLAINGREIKPDPAFDVFFRARGTASTWGPRGCGDNPGVRLPQSHQNSRFTQLGEKEKSLRAYKEKAEHPRPQPLLPRARRPA